MIMKKFFGFLFILVLLFIAFLFGFGLKKESKYIPSETVAIMFFRNLSVGNYEEALKYYGGSFETLQNWNPEVSSTDYLELIKRGCEQNGLNCLPLRTIIIDPSISVQGLNEEGLYDRITPYTVTFEKREGGLFEIGPCCGEEDTGERFSQFTVFIAEKEGNYIVLTLPPYTP